MLIAGRVLEDGLDCLPLLHRDDGLPIATVELATVFSHPDKARREKRFSKVHVAPQVPELAFDSASFPVRHNPSQRIACTDPPNCFPDQLALLCRLLFVDRLVPMPSLTEWPPAAKVPSALLGVLLVLAPHPLGHLLDFGFGHGSLDVEHGSLIRVAKVELAPG